MDKPIIEVKNLGKKYEISHMRGGYIALRDVISTAIRNPFSFLAHKTKRAIGLEKKEEFWALKNVNFSIGRGEVIGVVGANGAGKSTLLKILSQITPPSEGEVVLRGRVGSLLEVGTGFHPELTGRENIFLNGAILGMKKKEIAAKFDEIVAFAGVDKFLDTPVKHYSSGMYVRLAFSVAAHMEPDILLVDEVLAVGDAEFQKKCLGKMDEITKKNGRTIFFVSHNMGAIQNLCPRSILLNRGTVEKFGPTSDVIEYYLKRNFVSQKLIDRKDRRGKNELVITDCYLKNQEGIKANQIHSGEDATLVFEYECMPSKTFDNIAMAANIANLEGSSVCMLQNKMTKTDFGTISGKGTLECSMERIPLVQGRFVVSLRVMANEIEEDFVQNAMEFEVLPGDFFGSGTIMRLGQVYIGQKWSRRDSR